MGECARGVVDGFLATLQLFPDRARPAPDKVWVIVGVVGNDVPRGDLGGEVRFAADVLFPIWKKVALTPATPGPGSPVAVPCTGDTDRRRRSGRPRVPACERAKTRVRRARIAV